MLSTGISETFVGARPVPQRYEKEEIAPLRFTLRVTVIANGEALIVPVIVEPGWGFTPGVVAAAGVLSFVLRCSVVDPFPPPHAIEFNETDAVVGVTK